MQAEKAWLATLALPLTDTGADTGTEDFSTIPARQWTEITDKTVWMMGRYAHLGPQQRERTGGQVEPKWRFKARSAARRVLGRGKAWEEQGEEGAVRLRRAMEEL
jgi:hypothetical protein